MAAEQNKVTVFCSNLSTILSGQSGNKEESYAERVKKMKPPVACNACEDSEFLHQKYKDTVKYTEPNPEKMKAMKELMSHLHQADDTHNSNVIIAKQSATGVKRRPSTLGRLVHDDSDNETEAA